MECWPSLSHENDKSMRNCMMIAWSVLLFVACNSDSQDYLQSDQVKLSPPQVRVENVFFEKASSIKILPSEEGTKIYYTTDGTIPNPNSPIYNHPIQVNQSGTYNFMASQDDFMNSDVIEMQLFAMRKINIENVEIIKPSEKYPGIKDNLFDQKKGDFNFRSTAWKGFEGEAIINIDFQKEEEIKGFVVSSLIDHKSWIFAPEEITVIYVYADGKEVNHSEKFPETNTNDGKAKMEFSKILNEQSKLIKISIYIKGPEVIPSWHPGAGKKAWLFLDEIVFL